MTARPRVTLVADNDCGMFVVSFPTYAATVEWLTKQLAYVTTHAAEVADRDFEAQR